MRSGAQACPLGEGHAVHTHFSPLCPLGVSWLPASSLLDPVLEEGCEGWENRGMCEEGVPRCVLLRADTLSIHPPSNICPSVSPDPGLSPP